MATTSVATRSIALRGAARVRDIVGVFKLRIGVFIMTTALVGYAVTPGPALSLAQVLVLALAVLVASASAGAFNQYAEHRSDRLMARTRSRPFASGALRRSAKWPALMLAMQAAALGAAWMVLNAAAAFYIFLGGFCYAVVYTLWLKRRSSMNIVIGGLSGSFAVLAGAAAVDPAVGVHGWLLALALFLWTPPHFWSLAIAGQADYAAAGVPMLPVVVGTARAARVIYWNTVALLVASLLPVFFGAGLLYLAGALGGGLYFVYQARALVKAPGRPAAIRAFLASLVQLGVLLAAASIDSLLR